MTLDNLRTALILNNKMLLDRLKGFLHKHDNLETLNGLATNDTDNLTFKGNLVNEQYEVSDEDILQIVNEVMNELDKTLSNEGSNNSEENTGNNAENPPEDSETDNSTGNKWTTGGLGDAPGLNDRFENFGKEEGSSEEEEDTGGDN